MFKSFLQPSNIIKLYMKYWFELEFMCFLPETAWRVNSKIQVVVMVVAVLFTTSTPPSTPRKTLRRSKGCPFFKVREGKRNGHVKSLCPRDMGKQNTRKISDVHVGKDDLTMWYFYQLACIQVFLRLEHLRWFKVTIPLKLSYLFIYYPWTTFPKVSPSPPSTSTGEVPRYRVFWWSEPGKLGM